MLDLQMSLVFRRLKETQLTVKLAERRMGRLKVTMQFVDLHVIKNTFIEGRLALTYLTLEALDSLGAVVF